MNATLFRCTAWVCACALFAITASAWASSRDASSDLLSTVLLPSNAHAYVGMQRQDVVLQFGKPDATLSPDIWVYWDFHPVGRPHGDQIDTLLLTFANNKVTRIRVTERTLVETLLAQLQRYLAAKNPAGED